MSLSTAQAPARTRPPSSPTRPATRAARPRKAPGPYPGPDDQWQQQGACRTANPSLFYAPDNESNHQRRFRESAAKTVCSHCPVRVLCRAYAMKAGELVEIVLSEFAALRSKCPIPSGAVGLSGPITFLAAVSLQFTADRRWRSTKPCGN